MTMEFLKQEQTPVATLESEKEILEELRAENAVLQERIKYLERELGIDPLTGANNRGAFDKELDQSLKLIRGEVKDHREGREPLTKISLIMLDLDYFKKINDTFGHPAGDEVLRKVSALLKESGRDTDMVARVGGEEFVVFLRGVDKSFAASRAEELEAKIEQLTFDADPELKVTASLGVVSSEDSTDATVLYELADKTLYAAKQNGRNQVAVYTKDEV